ncbi:MAG: MarR family winged helix-turn-helix transcriptional regulator [Acidimicrobiia bacterium]
MTSRTATVSTDARGRSDPLAVVETELAMLTRTLEDMGRRSAIYRDLDRAGYLLTRTLASGAPTSIGGLAARVGLDATTVTRQVATLEASGYVRRRRDAADARVSIIELTAAGRRRMESVRRARHARIGELVEDWSEADRSAFGRLLGRLNESIRTHAPPG